MTKLKLDEMETIEIVYCRATKCSNNLGEGKCRITKVDTKISINAAGQCENSSWFNSPLNL